MAFPFALRSIRTCAIVLAGACSFRLPVPLWGQSTSPATAPQRSPVLVELFTSEGCSDCPPADNLLEQLDAKQSIPGVQAIVLSEHVTYWNHDGWHDPFSLDAMTERQQDYDRRFGLDSIYTPQMVVDGTTQFVGNNSKALIDALTNAAKTAKSPVSIENATWDHGDLVFSVHGTVSSHSKLYAVLAADATHSEVTRGENAGRTLHHTAVVREIKEFGGESSDGRSLKLPEVETNSKGEANGPMRLVVFLVDRKTGHVLGAAEKTLK